MIGPSLAMTFLGLFVSSNRWQFFKYFFRDDIYLIFVRRINPTDRFLGLSDSNALLKAFLEAVCITSNSGVLSTYYSLILGRN
jgi:hypothetical protein